MTTTTYWLSFADDDGFLGVAIVDGDDGASIMTMVDKTIELGCNPGRGSVQMCTIPPSDVIHAHYKNRLLTRDEVERLNSDEGDPQAKRAMN
jgi:hypothetical protein